MQSPGTLSENSPVASVFEYPQKSSDYYVDELWIWAKCKLLRSLPIIELRGLHFTCVLKVQFEKSVLKDLTNISDFFRPHLNSP